MRKDQRYTSVYLDPAAQEKLALLVERGGPGTNRSSLIRELIMDADGEILAAEEEKRQRLAELAAEMVSVLK